MSDYSMVDLLKDYKFANGSISFVSIESGIIALIIGLLKYDIGWGIGSFIAIMILYGFPLLAGVFSLTFSFVEAVVVYAFLSMYTASTWAWFISIFVFLLLVQIHRAFGSVHDIVFGYSLIIFDALMIGGCSYIYHETVLISILIIAVLSIVAFIPLVRVIESLVLALGTAFFMYMLALESLTVPYAIGIALFVLLYTSSAYIQAYRGIDYKVFFQTKKKQRLRQECTTEIQAFKSRMYEKYPELEKQYYYFSTEVCQTEDQRIKFNMDWYKYLSYLDLSREKISFNQFFEKEKLYRTSDYNRDFAKECAKESFSGQQEQGKEEQDIPNEGDMKIIYFVGIRNIEDLKKRYHDLQKIYHPNNQNGDITASQIIQREYEFLTQKLR